MTTNQQYPYLYLDIFSCPLLFSPPFSHITPCQLSEAASKVTLLEMLDEEELGGEEGSDSEQEKDGDLCNYSVQTAVHILMVCMF